MVEQMKTKSEPRVRFREFTDEWEEVKLGEVAEIVGGGTPSTGISEYWGGDIDWYSPAEIGNQIYVTESQKKITEFGLQKSSAKILPVGTVLFTSRAGIGNTAILAKQGSTNQGFQSILPRENILDSYFIFSRTNELKKYGEVTGAGSTFVEVSGKQMAQMPIRTPSFDEQRKIGTFFKQLDDTITLHQQKLDLLKRQKKALLQRLFPQKGEAEPKVRLRGFTDAWEEVKLGDLVNDGLIELSRGNVIPKGSNDGTYPVYSSSVTNKGLFTTIDDYMFDEELITWSIDGGGDFFYRSKHKFSVTNVSGVLRVLSENVDIKFLYAQLSDLHTRKTFDYLLKAHPSVIKTLYTLYIPSLEEQQAIGELFQTVDEQIRLAEDKVSQYKELKRALLQRLFV